MFLKKLKKKEKRGHTCRQFTSLRYWTGQRAKFLTEIL